MNTIPYISEYHAQKIWDRYYIDWKKINPDINILVGINGSGKTTLLNLIYKDCLKQKQNGDFAAKELLYIPSVDNISKNDNRAKSTALTQLLLGYLQTSTSNMTLMQYRMKILDVPEESEIIIKRIKLLNQCLNELFQKSSKTFEFERGSLVVKNDIGMKIDIENLSSGEKHLLIVILSVFLLEDRSALILMDEPENYMHISWQRLLIEKLVLMNPNAQLIISTHSPSLFGAGWGDKVVYMEDIMHL